MQLARYFSVILIICLAAAMMACSQDAQYDEVYTRVSEGVLHPGDPIPVPQDTPILTINGKIGASNQEGAIVMDRPTIEQVGLVEYRVHDPFADREILYRGVLMRDLLTLWQVAEDATTVQLTALNDYKVDVPLADFTQYPILFAMQADGIYMEPDYQGPAMLVFPVDDYQLDATVVRQRWIWQIKAIELK